MKKTTIAALALLALASCGGDDDPAAQATATPAATTAPPATTPPPATQAPPASSAPAQSAEPNPGPTSGKPTPEEAAQAFVVDWAELDRREASGYATRAAIDEAFSGQPPQAEFMGCFEEEDRFLCGHYYEGGALNVVVRDSDAYGHIVTDIFYVAD